MGSPPNPGFGSCVSSVRCVVDLSYSRSGLGWLNSIWVGPGDLIRALAAMAEDELGVQWTAAEVRARAMHVVRLEYQRQILSWPTTRRGWESATPVTRERRRAWSPSVSGRVDWAKTATRGWPPQQVATSRRVRVEVDVPRAVLAWVAQRLSLGLSEAEGSTGRQSAVAVARVFAGDPVRSPTSADLLDLDGLGAPWRSVSTIARALAAIERPSGLERLARTLVQPEGLPDRVFHLATLGEVLRTCAASGFVVKSLRPLDQLGAGPVFELSRAPAEKWQVWCESGAIWERFLEGPDHRELLGGLTNLEGDPFPVRAQRPDIVIARQGSTAIVLECKFPYESGSPSYVASGVAQAHYYAEHLQPAFVELHAIVVGPDEISRESRDLVVGGIRCRIDSPAGAASRVVEILQAATP